MSLDNKMIRNAMTVDVEDYFQVSAFEKFISRSDWDKLECRVMRNTDRVLEVFQECGTRATFFVLGWVAERYPELIRNIVAQGHELASHGYEHVRVIHQDRETFREDITRTKKILEDIGGVEVLGYRAASYSINKENLWALDELKNAGYEYSSSIYPVKHDLYGIPDAPRFAFRYNGDGILEIPITTTLFMGRNLPGGGGGYFRLFPYFLSRWIYRRVNRKEHQPGIFYFHPWEIDPGQPRQEGLPFKTRFRHYLNLDRTEKRIRKLLRDFAWDRMDNIYLNKQQ